MLIKLSNAMLADIAQVLLGVNRGAGMLDAYKEAVQIQARHVEDNVALEDIVEALVRKAQGRMQVVEFNPPGNLVDFLPFAINGHGFRGNESAS